MPRLITSFIVLTMSKKSRMPERGMSRTVELMRSRSDTESFFCMAGFHQHAEALVGFEHEMGGGGQHAFEGREPFADERRHLAQGRHLDLDYGRDAIQIKLVLVQHRLITADDSALLIIGDALVHLRDRE